MTVMKERAKKALKDLLRFHRQSNVEIDYKAELANAREEKYENIN